MAHAGGRPSKKDKAETWLQAFLSGGRRLSKEIEIVGKRQGYGFTSLREAKKVLGVISEKAGHLGYWRDPSVPEPSEAKQAEDDKNGEILRELKDIKRLAQAPQAVAQIPELDENEDIAPVDLTEADRDDLNRDKYDPNRDDINAVDQEGFKIWNPIEPSPDRKPSLPEIFRRLRGATKDKSLNDEVVALTFDWAYPNSGLSEVALVGLLRQCGFMVKPRVN
jgi:hypothetical protein